MFKSNRSTSNVKKRVLSRLLIFFLLINTLLAMGLPSKALADTLNPLSFGISALTTSPTPADISASLTKWAQQYNIPPVLLKAIAWQESGWRQFNPDGSVLMGGDKIGIGIMQISDYNASDPTQATYINKLKTDYDFNIAEGARVLNQKWRTVPKIGDGDRNKLENWYFAVMAYNSWADRNNPNYAQALGSRAYQDIVFSLVGRNYNSPYTSFTSPVTLPDPAILQQAPMDQSFRSQTWVSSYQSTWSPWFTVAHLGDLTVGNSNLVSNLTSTGGTLTPIAGALLAEPANGDYWYNYADSTAIYSLGYYMTGYNATTGSQRDGFASKLKSAAQKVINYGNNRLNAADYQTARKHFYAVLQLPKLDAALWQQAQNGYNQALQKSIKRLGGTTREETAITIAKEGWPTGASTVILAGSQAWVDALVSAPLARKNDAPLLLTPTNQLLPSVKDELQALQPKKIILVGGSGAISGQIEENLKTIYGSNNVTRIWGADRYGTATEIAKVVGVGTNKTLFLVNGEAAPDALSAASIAATLGQPILLTPKSGIPQTVSDFLQNNSIQLLHVVGGTGVVPDKILPAIRNDRSGGADRFKTMLAVLNNFKPSLPNLFFTNGAGDVFADAVAGAPLIAKVGGVLILTGNQALGTDVVSYVQQVKRYATFTNSAVGGHYYELGGTGVINIESDLTSRLQP